MRTWFRSTPGWRELELNSRISWRISGEKVSGCQVFPKVRGTRGERLENYFVDDGCEYSPSCLQCPLPVCKYDDPVGSKNGGSKIWVLTKLNRGSGVAAN